MDIGEVLTLLLALYGAFVSTVLGIREIKKQTRRIKVFLEYVYFYEYPQLTIVNIGERPITIVEVGISIGKHGEPVPANALFDVEKDPFPVKLSDGEHISLRLNGNLGLYILEKGRKLQVIIHDADGKSYSSYQKRGINPKWGSIEIIN